MITKKDIETAYARFNDFDRVDPLIIPRPTRMFEVGEECQVGNLDNCVIAEILFDGKAYRIDHNRITTREQPNTVPVTGIWWWFDVEYRVRANNDNPELFSDYLPGQLTTCSLGSFIHMMGHSGLVCDPRYQRGYVWTDADKESLIDSIFNRIGIGSFVFSRHGGYHHDKSTKIITYINLDGDEIQIPESRDYTCAVIDGQQRLTTIWKFYTNQFTYKGRYFKDLHFHDQNNFENTLASQRIFDEDSVSYKDVLSMFIKVNKGVPQDNTHLDKVQKQLEELT